MGTQVSWVLQVAIKSGKLDDATVLVKELVEATRDEPGALIYEYFISADQTAIHMYERYQDSDAAMVHMRNFGKSFGARWVATVDITGLTVYGTPSEELKGALGIMNPTYLGPLEGFAR